MRRAVRAARDLFPQGVASADPHPDKRHPVDQPEPSRGEPGRRSSPVEVAEDAGFANVVARAPRARALRRRRMDPLPP